MITKMTGRLERVEDDQVTLGVGAFEYEVLIPEFVRRQLQGRVGEEVSLFTIDYLEGNAMQGRMIPRLVGFLSEVEREFFELICSVDGLGFRKAMKAVVRPVRDIAQAIEEQDVKALSTLPGIGEATAERIVAKLRRKVPKFALMVDRGLPAEAPATRNLVEDVYQALLAVGHSPADSRKLLDAALTTGRKFKDFQDLMEEVYRQHRGGG
ncbi:MAG: Holliday junction DNA helicase RuvA [Planctomycetes bacterium]|nr:Holliday junction DNA helicase RuvA [Planctomycetota bacterium]